MLTNFAFIPECHDDANQDDIGAKTVPIWLHHTVTVFDVSSSNEMGFRHKMIYGTFLSS